MELPTGKGTDNPTEKTRQFMWSRVLVSFYTTVLVQHFRPYRAAMRFASKAMFGAPIGNTLGRGGESTTASLAFRLMQLAFGIFVTLDDDEEYDENSQQLYRLFMPIWMNVISDSIKNQDPLAIMRIHGQWATSAFETVRNLGTDD